MFVYATGPMGVACCQFCCAVDTMPGAGSAALLQTPPSHGNSCRGGPDTTRLLLQGQLSSWLVQQLDCSTGDLFLVLHNSSALL